MDTATVRAFVQATDAIERVRVGGDKVAQQTIDTLELLANKHLAFEEVTADTLEKIRDLVMSLYDEQARIMEAVNLMPTVEEMQALEEWVTELEEDFVHHQSCRGHA